MRAFEKGYSLLLGRSGKKTALVATSVLVLTAAITSLYFPMAPLYYAVLGAALFAITIAIDRSVINPRRAYYIAVVAATAVAILDLLSRKPPLTFTLVGAAIAAVVIQTLRCKSPVFVLPLVLASFLYYALGHFYMAIVSILYMVVVYSLRPAVRRMAGGLDAMCMFSSFIYAVFAEDDVIEDAFRQISKREAVPLHVYVIGKSHVVVVSDFHPGPFRHIGGGMLVDTLTREVESLGYRFTFLHGVGSHERDPVSKESVQKIVGAIRSALSTEIGGTPPAGITPRVVTRGDVKVTGFSLGRWPPLAIVSRVNSAADDIPVWVWQKVNTDFILVDAQNKHDGAVSWRVEDVESLSLALKALGEASPCGHFLIGLGKVDARDIDPLGLEIGPGGISAIVTKCDDLRSLLVVIDGNNMAGSLYGKIVARYGERGYGVVEVVTTDTHRATGIGFGRGYRIVGERLDHSRILELVDRAVREAERELGPHEVSYTRLLVEAEVLGEEGFKAISKAARMYKRAGILMISIIFLLPIAVIALFA